MKIERSANLRLNPWVSLSSSAPSAFPFKENLLHGIYKLRYMRFHAVTKSPVYNLSIKRSYIRRPNIPEQEPGGRSDARRVKTVES